MPLQKKAPLRKLSGQEQQELPQICRARVTPAVEVIQARILRAVARGPDD